MDGSVRKRTRSGAKFIEDKGKQVKKMRSVHFMVG